MTDTLEHVDLDAMLTNEPPCEFDHRESHCDIHVEWIVRWCKGAALLCSGAADIQSRRMRNPRNRCKECQESAGDCWVLRLI